MQRVLLSTRGAATALAVAILLAACGQKGALYLPEEKRNVVVTPANTVPMASPAPAATTEPATTTAPEADPPAAPAAPEDPTKQESQRRSNNPPRTN